MTNKEKYTTTEERVTTFRKFCRSQKRCDMCPASRSQSKSKCEFGFDWCALAWLALEYKDEEKPLPCPCCGSRFDRRAINWLGLDVCKAPELKDAELKPCPFCGGEAKLASQKYGLNFAYVKCSKCNAKVYVDEVEHLGMSLGEMSKLVIAEWNRRAKS